MIIIGLMSGTSVDAIDAAVGRFSVEGDQLVLETLGHAEFPWPADTRARLLAALPPAQTSLAEICALDVLVGAAFAEAAAAANAAFADGAAVLVASHGQNMFHLVEQGRARATLQIGQPAVIAEALGLPVISDFRARDVAAGGQGAPLASTFDALWLAGAEPRAALNLGGIANITVVAPGQALVAFDTGPASCLLDLEAQRISQGVMACDVDGRMARAGRVHAELLRRLLAEPYYARTAPKSTGRELFDRDYVAEHAAGLVLSDADLMATLTELTAITVADACAAHQVRAVIASGGGVRNPALMAALQRRLGAIALSTTEALGLPSDAKEAYLFALLGWLSWHGLPGTLGSAGENAAGEVSTGARGPRILGRISPGAGPLHLPAPARMPAGLVIRPI
jgi:anhydro-N-acetylmuramic acid kinase